MLLDELLSNEPFGKITCAFLDSRYDRKSIGNGVTINVYRPTILSRLKSQWDLFWKSWRTEEAPTILLFGNTPPLLPMRGRSIVYLQNCFLLPGIPVPRDSFRLWVRLWIERGLLFFCRPLFQELWVQTDWMVQAARGRFGSLKIEKRPFLPTLPPPAPFPKVYDIIHVSSLASHKNFHTFALALDLLDEQVTSSVSVLVILDGNTRSPLLERRSYRNIQLEIRSKLSRNELFELYQKSRISVISSSFESFCLPLYESHHFGLEILALDAPYSREIQSISRYSENTAESLRQGLLQHLRPGR